MTFRDLNIGDRFVFTHDRERESKLPVNLRIIARAKVSAQHYENTHADGDTSEGRVGAGDNPVRKLSDGETL